MGWKKNNKKQKDPATGWVPGKRFHKCGFTRWQRNVDVLSWWAFSVDIITTLYRCGTDWKLLKCGLRRYMVQKQSLIYGVRKKKTDKKKCV